MSILEKIVETRMRDLKLMKELIPVEKLAEAISYERKILSLPDYLRDSKRSGIIAEFKRRSPSRGVINEKACLEDVVAGYCRCGVSAVSVLTEPGFFGGSTDDLRSAREQCDVPLLRKDFILDPWQLYEARASGADAVLLIAAILGKKLVAELSETASQLGLKVLLEVHSERELATISPFIDVIGVNNRDLETFRVDTDLSLRLASHLPPDLTRISESGIDSPGLIRSLRGAGYHGFLIGDHFMRQADPAGALGHLTELITTLNA